MNLLDENIRQDQRVQLRRWRVPVRVLIEDFAHAGIKDPDILPLLHRLKRPTFFTHDRGPAPYFRVERIHEACGAAINDSTRPSAIIDRPDPARLAAIIDRPDPIRLGRKDRESAEECILFAPRSKPPRCKRPIGQPDGVRPIDVRT